MIKAYWEKLAAKIDGLSLRERLLIFIALAFILTALVNTLFINPLLAEQRKLSGQVVQQQEKMKEVQGRMEALVQARKDDANSPLRVRLDQLRQQIAEGDAYLKNCREQLVAPEHMAVLLQQMLQKNGKLQLISLQSLPPELLDKKAAQPENATAAPPDKQIYRHGIQITVRGNYLDLLRYLNELEHLPSSMLWGTAKMQVMQYPDAGLTLTIYTLSLGKTWLQV
ncbi:MAG: type II secretion system protein GspM [Gallionellaceae bacterium]|nr:type II secretion system protein GspM [Gallionellaceae bacterium]